MKTFKLQISSINRNIKIEILDTKTNKRNLFKSDKKLFHLKIKEILERVFIIKRESKL